MKKIAGKIPLKQKRRKSLPVLATCRNCGTMIQGPYCHQCGQNLFKGVRRSVKDLVFNALENIFVLDNKIFQTLRYLLFYPGRLTQEYTKGRVVSYVHPSKLFWFITIIFFFLFVSKFNIGETDDEDEDQGIVKIKKEVATAPENNVLPSDSTIAMKTSSVSDVKKDTTKIKATPSFESEEKENKRKKEVIGGFEELNKKKGDLQRYLSTYAPYFAFLLIPFFAFLMLLLFYKRAFFYVDYLAFSLHYHSFVFLLFSLYLLLERLFPNIDYPGTVYLLLPLLYFMVACRVVYRPKIRVLIGKTILMGILYFMVLITVAVVLGVFVVWMVKPEIFNSSFYNDIFN